MGLFWVKESLAKRSTWIFRTPCISLTLQCVPNMCLFIPNCQGSDAYPIWQLKKFAAHSRSQSTEFIMHLILHKAWYYLRRWKDPYGFHELFYLLGWQMERLHQAFLFRSKYMNIKCLKAGFKTLHDCTQWAVWFIHDAYRYRCGHAK